MVCEEGREGIEDCYCCTKHNEPCAADAKRELGDDQPQAACHGSREAGFRCVSLFLKGSLFGIDPACTEGSIERRSSPAGNTGST